MRRVVILGTGTNVGKTYVAASLARALRENDPTASVLALKPIESGVPAGTTEPNSAGRARPAPTGSDAYELALASTVPLPPTNPLYALPDPVSPHLAARRAGVSLSIELVTTWLQTAEQALTPSASNAFLIVETAGGALTPLTTKATNYDLAQAIPDAAWILVASDALGVLHDVAATSLALRALGRPPDYLVVSESRPADPSTGTNVRELATLQLPFPVFALPRGAHTCLRALARALAR